MKVRNLFLKSQKGKPLIAVDSIKANYNGLTGNTPCSPLRQVLILPSQTLSAFSLQPSDLRENIVVDGFDIHSLDSGTVLSIGNVKIRLTFHCEPCRVIKNIVNIKEMHHRRGVLGSIVDEGNIHQGDQIRIDGQLFESIPYSIKDRIKWYLDKISKPVYVSQLVFDIGLSRTYCRAIPRIVKQCPDIDPSLILYKNSRRLNTDITSRRNTNQLSLF